MEQEKKFADGFSFKRNENAPDFVVGRLSMKIEEAVAFMKENQKNGWINLDIKKARTGNFYLELDTYTPKGGESVSESKSVTNKTKSSLTMTDESDDDGLPF
jgi:hypothetical protein